jgi:hypothetical protein
MLFDKMNISYLLLECNIHLYFYVNKRWRKPKGQSVIDNSETLATFDQDTKRKRRQRKQKKNLKKINKKMNYMYPTTPRRLNPCVRERYAVHVSYNMALLIYSVFSWFSRLSVNNSYMIYIIRNPILWLGISAYGGGVFVSLFFERRCSPGYFFRNVNKWQLGFPIIKTNKRNNFYC